MPRVLNKKVDGIPDGAIYVGRPTKWGNPFRVDWDGDRDEVVDKFRHLLEKGDEGALVPYPKPGELQDLSRRRERILTDIEELRGRDLVCWCAPQACHADILLKIANEE